MAISATQAGSVFGSGVASGLSSGSKVFGASPIGTILGAVSSPITAALNYAYGRRAAQEAYDRQIDFWKMQNEYNLPSNARKRLEDAGFNPMAAVQGISQSQAAGGLSSVSLNPAASPSLFQNPLESIKVLAEIANYRSHSSLLVRQAASQFLDNLVKRANLPAAAKKALWYANHQEEVEEAGLRETQTQGDRNAAGAAYYNAQAQTETETRPLTIESLNKQISVDETRIDLMNSQLEVNRASKALLEAQTDTERERAANVAADTLLKGAQRLQSLADSRLTNLEADYKEAFNNIQLKDRSVTVFGKTFNFGSNLARELNAHLSSLISQSAISSEEAAAIGRTITLRNDAVEAQIWATRAQESKTRRDNTILQRGLNFVSSALGAVSQAAISAFAGGKGAASAMAPTFYSTNTWSY